MTGYTVLAIALICFTVLLITVIWAAVRINQTKGK